MSANVDQWRVSPARVGEFVFTGTGTAIIDGERVHETFSRDATKSDLSLTHIPCGARFVGNYRDEEGNVHEGIEISVMGPHEKLCPKRSRHVIVDNLRRMRRTPCAYYTICQELARFLGRDWQELLASWPEVPQLTDEEIRKLKAGTQVVVEWNEDRPGPYIYEVMVENGERCASDCPKTPLRTADRVRMMVWPDGLGSDTTTEGP